MPAGVVVILKFKNILLNIIPALLLISFLLAAYFDLTENIAEKKRDMAQQLLLIESNAHKITTHNIDRMRGVATYVSLHTEVDIDELNYFIEQVLRTDKNIISNIGIFKDTTAVYLYPYDPNKLMKGIDLTMIPSQRDGALRVKYKNDIVITSPVELVQGGIGIMTRLPILLNDGSYWGQLGFMLKFEDFIKGLGLISDNYKYQIRQFENDESSSHIVFDSGFDVKDISEEKKVDIPSGYWIISVSYPFDFSLLSSTFFFLLILGFITYFLAKKFIMELRKKIKELFFLAQRDLLTGLRNRRSVMSKLHYYNSVILFDIDDFKKINDTFGHYGGDVILVDLSNRITQVIRDNDVIVRWGGEEFIVLMKADKIESCLAVAKRIQNSMEKTFLVEDCQLNVTCSIGVAFSSEKSHVNMENVIANADKAMFEAKRNGKNRIEVYETY